MSQENIGTVKALYEAIGRGDVDAFVELLHPEVEMHPAVGGLLDLESTYWGREGAKHFMQTAWKGFEVTVEPEEIVELPGDRILAVERWQIRARDGIVTGLQLTDLYTFRDGFVVGVDGFREKSEALEAIGLSE